MKINWVFLLKLGVAVILLQTLFFKFSGAAESVYIFEKTGLGSVGRIGSGIVELIAAILLFVPSLTWLGALLGVGVMSGAILSHLTLLGIEVMGDGGTLFYLALFVFTGSAYLLFINKQHLIQLINQWKK